MLIQGHRWLNQLKVGKAHSLRDIAKQNNLDECYISRIINLTSLAPDIITTILDGEMPEQLNITDIAINPPKLWSQQRKKFLFIDNGKNSSASVA